MQYVYLTNNLYVKHTENAYLKNKVTNNPILRNWVEYLTKEDGQIDNKYIKRCLTSLVSDTQIQTKIRCHFIPLE